MARAAYFAPGVYVEEVPSAQQPIAGVGTSTAAFIGIVPSKLYIPVPNPDYDPVAARAAMNLAALTKKKESMDAGGIKDVVQAEAIKEQMARAQQTLQASLRQIASDLSTARAGLEAATKEEGETKAALETAEKDFEEASKAPEQKEDIRKKKGAFNTAKSAHEGVVGKIRQLTETIERLAGEEGDIKERLEAPAAPSAAPSPGATASGAKPGSSREPVEQDDTKFDDEPWDEKLLTKSILRPYVLKEFEVRVDPCDTKLCTNFSEYAKRFGNFSAYKTIPAIPYQNPDKWQFMPMHPGHHALTHAVNGFFTNGGTKCYVARIEGIEQLKDALKAFESIDEVALIAAPGLPKTSDTWEALMAYCEDINRENVFAVLDSPAVANDGDTEDVDIDHLSIPRPSKNAAYYFPHIEVVDPAKQLQDADPTRQIGARYRGRTYVPPSGHVAGIYARTDVERGVHKAPANCVVRGALEVKYYVSKPLQETLNPEGVNAIRIMNDAVTVWGARTCGGDRNGEWKYINVRRLFLFLQESIDEGTQWIVFEPNDPGLWSKIRLNVSAFLTNVWRNGALFGLTPEEAFYVKCDAETNPREVRDLGMVVTEIGVAIVRPAEFVIFRITQSTGQQRG